MQWRICLWRLQLRPPGLMWTPLSTCPQPSGRSYTSDLSSDCLLSLRLIPHATLFAVLFADADVVTYLCVLTCFALTALTIVLARSSGVFTGTIVRKSRERRYQIFLTKEAALAAQVSSRHCRHLYVGMRAWQCIMQCNRACMLFTCLDNAMMAFACMKHLT